MQKEKILTSFLNLSDNNFFGSTLTEINNEELKQSLVNLRKEYSSEMLTPGCKSCKKNALKRKYSTAVESTINKYENHS